MKKWLKILIMFVASIVILVGCSDGSENAEDAEAINEGTIMVVVSETEADEVYSEQEIDIEEGDILMDIMKENYDIEEDEGFINEIDGVAPEEGEEKAWIYTVNGEEALVGAEEYELSIDDEVVFNLEAWE